MSSINAAQLGITQTAKLPSELNGQSIKGDSSQADNKLTDAQNTKKAFTQFVGETFYGTMLKSMRKTTSEPAYFHGGQAEELFQGQLDQQIASDMAADGSSGLAKALFQNQFPKEAALIAEYNASQNSNQASLSDLDQLARR